MHRDLACPPLPRYTLADELSDTGERSGEALVHVQPGGRLLPFQRVGERSP